MFFTISHHTEYTKPANQRNSRNGAGVLRKGGFYWKTLFPEWKYRSKNRLFPLANWCFDTSFTSRRWILIYFLRWIQVVKILNRQGWAYFSFEGGSLLVGRRCFWSGNYVFCVEDGWLCEGTGLPKYPQNWSSRGHFGFEIPICECNSLDFCTHFPRGEGRKKGPQQVYFPSISAIFVQRTDISAWKNSLCRYVYVLKKKW